MMTDINLKRGDQCFAAFQRQRIASAAELVDSLCTMCRLCAHLLLICPHLHLAVGPRRQNGGDIGTTGDRVQANKVRPHLSLFIG